MFQFVAIVTQYPYEHGDHILNGCDSSLKGYLRSKASLRVALCANSFDYSFEKKAQGKQSSGYFSCEKKFFLFPFL